MARRAETKREAADRMLREAIVAHAVAYDIADPDDELLSDFAIVSSWQPVQQDGRTRYLTHFAAPEIPTHVAVGLFRTAELLVSQLEEEE